MVIELTNHSRKLRNEAEIIKNEIITWRFIDEAPKRELIWWVTIDKKTSKDLDDWIWAEKNKNWYSIFVSIADVAEVIKPYTLLDLDALSRSTSVYTNHHVYHMFPNEISTDICSLNDKTKRPTITTRIDLDNDYNVIWSEIFESIFENKKRFCYKQFNKSFNNYGEQYHNELNMFHDIAKWLYKKRVWYWAKTDFQEKVTLNLDIKNNIVDNSVASFIIQEFMIAKNIEDAKINFKEKINWVFRLHMPWLKWKQNFKQTIERAFYNFKSWFHYWLWENFYWHFTSPIRRYADLINHRQQKAWIRKDKEVYNINELRKIIIDINTRIEETLDIEKQYNDETNKKRIERFLKKLKQDNYQNLSSISDIKFSSMIKFFINNPEYLYIDKIYEEIDYRIDNNLLTNKDLARITSFSNDITQFNYFKEKIILKQE